MKNNLFKRIFAAVLCVALAASATACAKKTADTAPSEAPETEVVEVEEEIAEGENEEASEDAVEIVTEEESEEIADELTDEEEPAEEAVLSTEDEEKFSYSDGLDENGFFEGVTALDYVTLPDDYNAVKIPAENYVPEDESVDSQVNYYLSSFASNEEITDRAVEDGDTVNIDYVGSVDGVEFMGGNTQGQGTDVTIGVTQYIDDFLDQLIGHMPGETINVEVTFPEGYSTSKDAEGNEIILENKDAVFVTTINYISVPVEPELTDEFVKENFSEEKGWTTVDEMKASVKDEIQKNNINGFIQNYITENMTVSEVPESVYQFQVSCMMNYYKSYAKQYGVDFETFMKDYLGFTSEEDLIESNAESNRSSSGFFVKIQAVAEKEGLTVSDDKLKEYFVNNMGTEDYSIYEEMYGLPYIKQIVLEQIVVEYLAENAVLG